jgi:hypothetical protein
MLLFASALIAATVASSAPAAPTGDMPIINPKAGQPANCPATSRYEASRRGKTPRAQKLNELPDADVYRAVYRRIGGCEAPIIVKYGVVGH